MVSQLWILMTNDFLFYLLKYDFRLIDHQLKFMFACSIDACDRRNGISLQLHISQL